MAIDPSAYVDNSTISETETLVIGKKAECPIFRTLTAPKEAARPEHRYPQPALSYHASAEGSTARRDGAA
jgi:hypothetical protein